MGGNWFVPSQTHLEASSHKRCWALRGTHTSPRQHESGLLSRLDGLQRQRVPPGFPSLHPTSPSLVAA